MNRNSNVYTVIYASVMVLLVAIVLAFTSQSLRGLQKENVANDKRQQILRSINVNASADLVKAKYMELIKESFLVNKEGQKVEGEVFGADVKASEAKGEYPVFVAEVNGETKYILAMYGSGLWGPIWGYVSVNADGNTIYGTDFSHEGETPGLGAEIAKPAFSAEFVGKQLFKNNTFKSVAVVKKGHTAEGQDYVDGISGGTITSKGVNAMLYDSLSGYVKFLTSKK